MREPLRCRNVPNHRLTRQEQKTVPLENRLKGIDRVGQALTKVGRQDDHEAAVLFEMR